MSGILAAIATLVVLVLCAPFGGAEEQYTYTIDKKPVTKNQYDAYILTQEGNALVEKDQVAAAGEKFKKAIELDPKLTLARCNYGFVLMRQGKYDEGIALLKVVVAESPDTAIAWGTLGGCYQSVGKIPDAISCYRKYVSLSPKSPDARRVTDLIKTLQQEAAARKTSDEASSSDDSSDEYLKLASTTGRKWPARSMPIAVYVPQTSTAKGFKSAHRKILLDAFDQWAAASGGCVRFTFVDQKAKAKLVCDWTDDPSKLGSEGELGGKARVLFAGDDIGTAEIILLTNLVLGDIHLTDQLAGKVALHEIGHALGLLGHSDARGDIMFFSLDVSERPPSLSPRDANTLQALYAPAASADPAASDSGAASNSGAASDSAADSENEGSNQKQSSD